MTSSPPAPLDAKQSVRARWGRVVRRLVPWMLFAGLIYLVGTRLAGHPLDRGTLAPPLTVELDDGSRFDLAQHAGSVVVVNFWGTWCPPCRTEAPALREAHRQLLPRGGRVIGLSLDNATLPQVASAARRLGMTYPIAMSDDAIENRFHIEALPTTFVVGPDGRIQESFVGKVSAGELIAAIDAATPTTPRVAAAPP